MNINGTAQYAHSTLVQLTVATGTVSSNYEWFRHWYWYMAESPCLGFPPFLTAHFNTIVLTYHDRLQWMSMASHMAVESASPILLLLHTSPSAQSTSFIVWGWLLSSFMEWGSPSIISCTLYTPKLFVVYQKQTSMLFEVIIFLLFVFCKLLALNRQFTLKMGSNIKMVLSVAIIDVHQDCTLGHWQITEPII